MKKIILSAVALVAICGTANAQYAPEKNDISVEIGFTPFKSSGDVFNLKDEFQFKARWMFTDKDALRLKFGLGIDNSTENKDYSTGSKDLLDLAGANYTVGTQEIKNKMSHFSIYAGYERHFLISERIDLYAGGELGYSKTSYSATVKDNNTNETYDTSAKLASKATSTSDVEYTAQDAKGNTSLNSFNVAAFTGIDFYVYKGLYLGAELGIKFATGKNPKQSYYEATTTTSGMDYTNNVASSSVLHYSSETGLTTGTQTVGSTTKEINQLGAKSLSETSNTSLKFYVEPAFRLGWKF